MMLATTILLAIVLTTFAVWRLNRRLVACKDDRVVMAELVSDGRKGG
jgi:hypothetical protein